MTRKNDELESVLNAASLAAEEYDADIYFYSGPIDDEGLGSIAPQIAHKKRDRAILILVTNGGLANAAFQIARLFQSTYKEFTLFCPSRCKSAGTLIALGAHRLIMDVFSELGPLDVQLIKQNEIFSRKSGLLAKSSFDALSDSAFELYEKLMIGITVRSQGNVSFKVASELAASMASTMLAPVYAQINPEIVGSENRDLNIAFEYGSRLIKASMNADINAVHQLVSGYPSHDFIIDQVEARELFKNVEQPSETLYKIVGLIGDAAFSEAPTVIACALTAAPDGANENVQEPAPPSAVQPGGDDIVPRVDGSRGADRNSNQEPPSEGGTAEAEPEHPATPHSTAIQPAKVTRLKL